MSSASTRLTLDLKLDSEPISGALRQAGGSTTPFSGWIELVSLLQTAATSQETHADQLTPLPVAPRPQEAI